MPEQDILIQQLLLGFTKKVTLRLQYCNPKSFQLSLANKRINFHIDVTLLRAGLVQLVSASSPSHQVLGSKPSLCRISAGVRLCFGYSFPQTPLV
jgi:hypothetical protein